MNDDPSFPPSSSSSTSLILPSTESDTGLFAGNPEYVLVTKSLSALKVQLVQAQRDIQTLQELKSQALADPQTFLELLKSREECGRRFPRMQKVHTVPPIPLASYQRRYSRRAHGKYDQNLGYLVGRIEELQNRRLVGQLSPCLPISGTSISGSGGGGGYFNQSILAPRDSIRRRFMEILGVPSRSASAPIICYNDQVPLNFYTEGGGGGGMDEIVESPPLGRGGELAIPNRGSIFSPQPRKAGSVQFTMPFLPPPQLLEGGLRNSSPTCGDGSLGPPSFTTPIANGNDDGSSFKPNNKRRRGGASSSSSLSKRETSNHNLPWSEEEKQRLVELMAIYPEEEVQARRYAKIAAAISTRTPSQVANRVNKILSRKKKRLDEKIDPGDNIDELLDEEMRQSVEYREYKRLGRQIEALEADPFISVHLGFRCDDCGVEPIVGVRWRCTKCHEPQAIDLCEECYEVGEFITLNHRPDHRFIRHVS